jgi:hypothetical protein
VNVTKGEYRRGGGAGARLKVGRVLGRGNRRQLSRENYEKTRLRGRNFRANLGLGLC